MKKLLILLASLAVLIVGCSATLNPKSQLKTTTATVQTQVQQEQDALKTIGSTVNAFPSAFEKAYPENPQTDLKKENGPVKKLFDRRAAAFKSLEAANSALVGANNTLTKLNNQPSEDLSIIHI